MPNINDIKENSVDTQYCSLLCDILLNGYEKGDRTGTGSKAVFGRMFQHNMKDGFPLLTSKKMYTKGIIVELLWFLGKHMADDKYKSLGQTNIRYLLDNNCKIWVGDAYKKYKSNINWNIGSPDFNVDSKGLAVMLTEEEFVTKIRNNDTFAAKHGDLGPIYGKQWRSFGPDVIEAQSFEKFCDAPEIPVVYATQKPLMNQDEMLDRVIAGDCEVKAYNSLVNSVNYGGLDQIQALMNDLRVNPESRRLIVSAWNPLELEDMTLPPCHYGFQLDTRVLTLEERIEIADEETKTFISSKNLYSGQQHDLLNIVNVPKRALSLAWNQRSVDVPLGLPFNIASYAFLLSMIAHCANMVPDKLTGFFGNTHIYDNQLEGVHIQLANPTYKLPTLSIKRSGVRFNDPAYFEIDDLIITEYQNSGTVVYPLSN